MPRFFIPPDGLQGGRFVLEGAEARHLTQVLRQKKGDSVELLDGLGGVYQGEIQSVSKLSVEGRVLSQEKRPPRPLRVRLFQALSRGNRFEWMVEKAAELGVGELIPLQTEHCVVSIPPQKISERIERWQKIAQAGAKQSGQAFLMGVRPPQKVQDVFGSSENEADLTLFPWEKEKSLTLKQALAPLQAAAGTVNVLVGPEGGFSEEEAAVAKQKKASLVTLGPSILRAETAGIYVASVLFYESENLSHNEAKGLR